MDLTALRAIVGERGVVDDPDRLAGHRADWTGRFVGDPAAVVLPTTTTQVAELVGWCAARRVAIVPQGGNTGLVGATMAPTGSILVVLTRMDQIDDVDADAGQVTAQAGATLAEVQTAASAAGWHYGVDLAARDTATIGGTMATNAGGLHVLRYGDSRRQLLGIEAVTGTGAVVGDLRGLVKDNTGYHLPSLFAGSEGTLGIITRVRVALVSPPGDLAVGVAGFDSVRAAVDAAARLRRTFRGLRALELMLDDGVALTSTAFGLPSLLEGSRAMLLAEADGGPTVLEDLGLALTRFASPERVVMADDAAGRAALWRYRELHTDAIARLGVPHKLDVTLPASTLAGFVEQVGGIVSAVAPGSRTFVFGHAGDGNVHVNVLGPDDNDERVDVAVLEAVAARGGSISAEHGIGRAKAPMLHLNRTPAELAVFRAVKEAFDPFHILNPGALLAR